MPITDQKKVLLIEDDTFLLQMYATKLGAENFVVYTAPDGERGIKLAQENIPDVILLDLLMPVMDGFEVLTQLKGNPGTKNIPVIVLSNLSQREDIQRCLDLGAADYLIKAQFIPSEVIAKIKKVLADNTN